MCVYNKHATHRSKLKVYFDEVECDLLIMLFRTRSE